MRLRWTPLAVADLHGIDEYLKEHHPRYREATIRKLYGKLRALKDAPNIGRLGRIAGTRELVFPPMPYVAVYRISGETIEVLRMYHGSQNWPVA